MSVRGFVLAGVASLAGLACGLGFVVSPASAAIGHNYETQIAGASPTEPFGEPWGLAFDGSGSLFVADAGQEAIDVFDASNLFVPPQLKSTALREHYTRGVAVSASGVVYVAESGPETIAVFEPEGANKYKLLQETKFGGYVFTAVDNHPVEPSDPRAGDVYVLNSGLHVVKVDAQGRLEGTGEVIPGPPGGFSLGGSGAGLAVDAANGNVYVANPSEKKVDVFDDNGTEQPLLELTGAETPQGAGAFSPNAVAIDNANNVVYVIDGTGDVVDEFSKTGAYLGQITGQSTPTERFVAPVAVAVQEHAGSTQGDVYVSDRGAKVVDVFGHGVVLADVKSEPASNIRRSTVTLNGTVNPDEVPVTACAFEYRSSEEASFTHTEACSPSPGSGNAPVAVSAEVSGLTPGTTYYYRLAATNANGTNRGGEESFTTPLAVDGVSTGPAEEVTATTAKLTGALSPDGTDAHYYFEYGTTTSYGSSIPLPPGTDAGTGGPGCVPPGGGSCVPVAASATPGSLESDTTYHYRIVAVNSAGRTDGQDETVTTAGPGIEDESVSDVAGTSATLSATINPNGAATSYYFLYSTSSSGGCQADPSSCVSVPSPAGSVGSGSAPVTVRVHLQGLTPVTAYRFRVVATSAAFPTEIAYGEEGTLTTQPVGGEFALPDARVWEMVSPPNKRGSGIEPMTREGGAIQASEAGDAFTYVANGPVVAHPAGATSPELTQVFSSRGTGGWSTSDISTPHDAVSELFPGRLSEYPLFSGDLSHGVVEPKGETPLPPLMKGAEKTLYLRDNTNESYRALVTAENVPPGKKFGDVNAGNTISFEGSTPDLSHVILSSEEALTENAFRDLGRNRNLYEWAGGNLQLVSILPPDQGGKEIAASANEEDAVLGGLNSPVRNAVSSDGSRVVWGATGGHLYMRDMARGETIQLDVPDGRSGKSPGFQGAASDGSKVFFTDERRLTSDSHAGAYAPDLYVFELAGGPGPLSGHVTDLTGGNSGAESANVVGDIAGYNENGDYVYFTAGGSLVPGVAPGRNLYVEHYNGTAWEAPRLIASLSSGDESDWGKENPGDLGLLATRVSPDGRYLAFMSQQRLTSYDNRDVKSGASDQEVYLFDVKTGRLACASCEASGARPEGVFDDPSTGHLLVDRAKTSSNLWLAGSVPDWTLANLTAAYYQSRYLSNEGRLFFDSPVALVPADVNGKEDVYEFEPLGSGPEGSGRCTTASASASVVFDAAADGCVGLISSGTSPEESAFLDASARGPGGEEGEDVFFLTASKLGSGDSDSAFDVYDARECATGASCSAPVAISPACSTADSCRAAPVAQPSVFGAPSSATFSGIGNVSLLGPKPAVTPRRLTRAQKLASALRACKRRPRRGRDACRAHAKRRYSARASRSTQISKRGR